MSSQKRTLIEYEDAPSGSVYFYNYKEPLMRFEGGYGFLGALIYDEGSGKLQCHYCGEWFDYLPYHLRRKHNSRASEYREDVGLNRRAALINEETRAKFIENGIRNGKKHLIRSFNRNGWKHRPETIQKMRKAQQNKRMELKNKTNTCPEQLLDRLRKLCDDLGRVPTKPEITFYDTLRRVYGSLRNALEIIGQSPRKPGTRAKIVYTEDGLISLLQDFEERNGRKPSASDCRRKLLPNVTAYSRRFGSWSNALKVAFPEPSVLDLRELVPFTPNSSPL